MHQEGEDVKSLYTLRSRERQIYSLLAMLRFSICAQEGGLEGAGAGFFLAGGDEPGAKLTYPAQQSSGVHVIQFRTSAKHEAIDSSVTVRGRFVSCG